MRTKIIISLSLLLTNLAWGVDQSQEQTLRNKAIECHQQISHLSKDDLTPVDGNIVMGVGISTRVGNAQVISKGLPVDVSRMLLTAAMLRKTDALVYILIADAEAVEYGVSQEETAGKLAEYNKSLQHLLNLWELDQNYYVIMPTSTIRAKVDWDQYKQGITLGKGCLMSIPEGAENYIRSQTADIHYAYKVLGARCKIGWSISPQWNEKAWDERLYDSYLPNLEGMRLVYTKSLVSGSSPYGAYDRGGLKDNRPLVIIGSNNVQLYKALVEVNDKKGWRGLNQKSIQEMLLNYAKLMEGLHNQKITESLGKYQTEDEKALYVLNLLSGRSVQM